MTSADVLAPAVREGAEAGREAALEEARARAEQARDRVRRLQAVTAALSQARTAEDVGAAMVLQAYDALGVASALAFRREPGGDALQLLASLGHEGACARASARVPLAEPLPVTAAARTGAPVFVGAVVEAADLYPALAERLPESARAGATAALPLRAGGEVIGALALTFAEPRGFDDEVRGFLATVADQCALALERALLFDAERRTRAILSAVLEAAPVGVALLDAGFRFRMISRPLAEMNGLPPEAHLDATPRALVPGLPVAEMEAAWRQALERGVPVLDLPLSGETPAAPGELRHWRQSWYPVRDGDEILGVGLIVREVTAERQAEEFQRHVLGIVGHDLRDPLTTVVMTARLLLAVAGASPEVRELAARIQRAGDRMERMIGVLLDYARARAGQAIPVRPAPCRLDAVLRALAEEQATAHPGRAVDLEVEGDAAGAWDPGRLEQAVANLLSSASARAAPGAAVRARITGGPDEVRLEVSSPGAPPGADELTRLFEPFARVAAGGEAGERLGLGLFIARAIVEAHGGRAEARAGEDGLVVEVALPRRPA